MLRRYSDAWFATAKRRKDGEVSARYPRRKRGLVPVRWYHGTFRLDGRVLAIPVARGCPPLAIRLDRDIPYLPGQVRSVTLGYDAGRLYADVTAEVPVTVYPPGQGPDPDRTAGIDLGIIHPYAAGPEGQGLLVSGRAIRAECRQHLRDRKGRSRAAAAAHEAGGARLAPVAPAPAQREAKRGPGMPGGSGRPSTKPQRGHQLGGGATGSAPWRSGTRAASCTSKQDGGTASGTGTGGSGTDARPVGQGRGRRDHRAPGRRAGHVVHLPACARRVRNPPAGTSPAPIAGRQATAT